MALAVEDLPSGCDPREPLVWFVPHLPALSVADAVVVPAQARQIPQVGPTAVLGVLDVVEITPRRGSVAPREHAAAVTHACGSALVPVGEPHRAPEVERTAERVDHERVQDRITHEQRCHRLVDASSIARCGCSERIGLHDERDIGRRRVPRCLGRTATAQQVDQGRGQQLVP
jgi:hypothetical protein